MSDCLVWLLSDELGREKLALLVLCTLAIYVVATQLAWRLGQSSVGHRVVSALGRSWFGRWTAQIIRVLYYVGIPCAVLWRGALLREMGIPTTYVGHNSGSAILGSMGLADARDVLRFGTGLAIGGGVLCVLVLVWIWYARTVLAMQRPWPGKPWPLIPWWAALREALLLQVLWAFYRGSMVTLTDNWFQAAFLSLALIAFSWVLNPRRRHDLFTPHGHLVVQDWMTALFTAFASLTIQALWLLVLMHMLWVWASGRTLAHLSQYQDLAKARLTKLD